MKVEEPTNLSQLCVMSFQMVYLYILGKRHPRTVWQRKQLGGHDGSGGARKLVSTTRASVYRFACLPAGSVVVTTAPASGSYW